MSIVSVIVTDQPLAEVTPQKYESALGVPHCRHQLLSGMCEVTKDQDGEIGAAPTKFLHRGDRGGARP
ncbi:hypothetical protein A2J03_15185 [Rhodococcus sp. EPR-157]|nr:hypothetical protein A2J03_15185 [Rhodococcus sp. EPR-157]